MTGSALTPVVFDLDGTLADTLGDITEAANQLLEGEGIGPLPRATVAGFVGWGDVVFVERLMAETGLDPERKDALRARFLPIYEACSQDTKLFDGVAEVLQAFAARGVPLGICTNKPSGPLAHVLQGLPEASLFSAVVAGDSLPQRKPDPAPLRLAFEQLGAQSGLYVGDTIVDAQCAQRAGVPFAFFKGGIGATPLDQISCDLAFDDFADLLGFYDGLA